MFDGRWRHAVDRSTKPVGNALVRVGVTADVLTAFGLVMSVTSSFVIGSGHLLWAIAMLFASGLPDLFDGAVAKSSGTASVRGAFFDSVADRVSDAFWFGGVSWYLVARHHGSSALLPFGVLAVTSLVSYQRAKAELLGLSANGGLMERAERFILLGLVFVAGSVSAAAFVPALWVFFALVCATAVGRFVSVWRAAGAPVPAAPVRVAPVRVAPVRVAPVRASSERAHFQWLQSDSERRLSIRRTRAQERWQAWRRARLDRASSRPVRQWRPMESIERFRARRALERFGSRGSARRERVRRRHAPGSGVPGSGVPGS